MFDTVLVANRGEIAVRVIATLKAMGIRAVAVYSDADAGARHVAEADEAVRIGPAPARQSYLNITAILEAVRRSGAQAVHPGYGFLSENAEFAAALHDAGVVFIGPPTAAIETMGDKITAKAAVAEFGVPVVPGIARPGLSDAELTDAAAEIGYPVLIKPSAGEAVKACVWCRTRRNSPTPWPGHVGSPRRRSVTTHCFWNDSSCARDTSRCRCSPTPTAPWCTWGAGVQSAAPSPEGDRRGAVTAAGRGHPGADRCRRL